jgi:site-specific recombinase XerD
MLTNFEMQSVILKAPCIKYKAIIGVLYATGARNMELRNIKLTDLNDFSIVLRVTKNRRERVVPVPNTLRILLKKHIAINEPVTYLFEGERPGHQLSERALQYIVKECFFDSSNPAMSPHQIRHHFITHLIEAGKNPFEVKILAGHAWLKTTEHYFHTSEHWLKQFNLVPEII